jgi:hypothetical protein
MYNNSVGKQELNNGFFLFEAIKAVLYVTKQLSFFQSKENHRVCNSNICFTAFPAGKKLKLNDYTTKSK